MCDGWEHFMPAAPEPAPPPAGLSLADRALKAVAHTRGTSVDIGAVLDIPMRECSSILSRLYRQGWLDRTRMKINDRITYMYRIKGEPE